MTGGGTHLMKMGGQIRSSGRKNSFQWNGVLLPVERTKKQQMLKKIQEIAIIASTALPLEAFPPSSGSENGCHFIEMPPPDFDHTKRLTK